MHHASDGAEGLYTLLGGKLTAWRAISTAVADQILAGRADSGRRLHATNRLVEPTAPDPSGGATAQRLWRLYGGRSDEVRRWIEQDRWWGEPLISGQPALRAEVAHAFHSEWATRLADAVRRRLALGFGPDLGRAAAEAAAEVAGTAFGWDGARIRAEQEDFTAEIGEHRLP